jgi:hypothetical protein
MTRSKLGLVMGFAVGAAGLAAACSGGSSNGGAPGGSDGGGGDATVPVGEGGGPEGGEAAATAPEGGSGGVADAGDAGASACAPPGVATDSVLCVTVSHEAIAFLSDPAFDGKGLLTLGVYSNATAGDDAGYAALLLPSQDAGVGDAGLALLDLSQPVPVVRFELPATTAYVRAIFIDDPATLADGGSLQAGWWLGGYDLSHGIDNAPLMPVPLTAGAVKDVTIDLVALRQLTLTVTRAPGVVPAGNGQGPITALAANTGILSDASTYLYGLGRSACGDVSGDASAVVPGWVLGSGPYSMVVTLDDFDAGGDFPAGGMFSLVLDAGLLAVPSTDLLTYDAGAYQVTGSATLTYVNPWDGGADADTVSCP